MDSNSNVETDNNMTSVLNIPTESGETSLSDVDKSSLITECNVKTKSNIVPAENVNAVSESKDDKVSDMTTNINKVTESDNETAVANVAPKVDMIVKFKEGTVSDHIPQKSNLEFVSNISDNVTKATDYDGTVADPSEITVSVDKILIFNFPPEFNVITNSKVTPGPKITQESDETRDSEVMTAEFNKKSNETSKLDKKARPTVDPESNIVVASNKTTECDEMIAESNATPLSDEPCESNVVSKSNKTDEPNVDSASKIIKASNKTTGCDEMIAESDDPAKSNVVSELNTTVEPNPNPESKQKVESNFNKTTESDEMIAESSATTLLDEPIGSNVAPKLNITDRPNVSPESKMIDEIIAESDEPAKSNVAIESNTTAKPNSNPELKQKVESNVNKATKCDEMIAESSATPLLDEPIGSNVAPKLNITEWPNLNLESNMIDEIIVESDEPAKSNVAIELKTTAEPNENPELINNVESNVNAYVSDDLEAEPAAPELNMPAKCNTAPEDITSKSAAETDCGHIMITESKEALEYEPDKKITVEGEIENKDKLMKEEILTEVEVKIDGAETLTTDEIKALQLNLRPRRAEKRRYADLSEKNIEKNLDLEYKERLKELKVESRDRRKKSTAAIQHVMKYKAALAKSKLNKSSYSCDFCDFVTAKKTRFSCHIRKHQRQECHTFTCPHCDQDFDTNAKLVKHKATHDTTDQTFLCHKCKVAFSNYLDWSVHNVTHLKDFTCPECHIDYAKPYLLASHLGTHAEPKKVKCEECNKLVQARMYNLHLKMHKLNFECVECGKKFDRNFNLENHMTYHTGVKDYQCWYCGKGFRFPGGRLVHLRLHTQEKLFSCSVCGQAFHQATDLKRHEQRKHSDVKNFECDHCKRKFTYKEQLRMHMRVHLNYKPYSCSQCDAKFYSLPAFKFHVVKVHIRKKEYSCELCNKFFYHKTCLSKHQDTKIHKNRMFSVQSVAGNSVE